MKQKTKADIIQAADEGATLPKDTELTAITGCAYSGGPVAQAWADLPIYIDLETLKTRKQIPLLYNHYNAPLSRLGEVTATVDNNALQISGGIDPEAQGADVIISSGKKIPWQLSIGADAGTMEQADGNITINGREIQGPVYIARNATLHEVSIVAVGADEETSLQIAAALKFQQETNKHNILQPTKKENKMENNTPQPDVNAIKAAAVEAERARVAEISTICENHPQISAKAVAEGWDTNKTRAAVLDAIKASYTTTAPNITATDSTITQKTLLAAAMQSAGLNEDTIIKATGQKELEAADKNWNGSIGLQELIIEAAAANGVHSLPRALNKSNWYNVTQQAINASASQVSLPGILGGVISRSLIQGFGAVDSSWQEIATERSVNDFREVTSYRLTSDGGFQKLGPSGEFKHGALGETQYRAKAETYGKMLGITREDIINDDLGALAQIPAHLGLDAAMKFNEVFWAEFMDNADFFSVENKNILEGNPLGVEGLTAALKAFRGLKDESGRILGTVPAVLLVPPALEVLAGQLYKDSAVIPVGLGNSAKVAPASNPHAGKYAPVVSPYLEAAEIPGNSSTAYYLLAKPVFRSAMQVVFLNGVKTPTIESSEMSFNQLGIQFRAYFDFGCVKMEPLAGVKVVGA